MKITEKDTYTIIEADEGKALKKSTQVSDYSTLTRIALGKGDYPGNYADCLYGEGIEVKYSKLKIYAAIVQLGKQTQTDKWTSLKSWLQTKDIDGMNAWEAFNFAQEISSLHPMFETLAEEAAEVLGLTSSELSALLEQCVLDE